MAVLPPAVSEAAVHPIAAKIRMLLLLGVIAMQTARLYAVLCGT